jgi:hypothetical protein
MSQMSNIARVRLPSICIIDHHRSWGRMSGMYVKARSKNYPSIGPFNVRKFGASQYKEDENDQSQAPRGTPEL